MFKFRNVTGTGGEDGGGGRGGGGGDGGGIRGGARERRGGEGGGKYGMKLEGKERTALQVISHGNLNEIMQNLFIAERPPS